MLDNTTFQTVEGIKRPINQETLVVRLTQAISKRHIDIYLTTFNNAYAKVNSQLEVSSDELMKYFNTLAKYRVDKVNGRKVPLESKQLRIPSVYALALLHVGKVYDPEQGIHLVPEFEVTEDEIMTPNEALEFSYAKLTLLEQLGVTFVFGLPKDLDGSLEAMYFHFSADQVLRHNDRAHPGMAALASFFEFQQLQSILSHRVSYGFISEQELILRQIIMKTTS